MYNNPSDYVMVGGEYYMKCRTPYDMSSDKVELVPWPRSQINEDFRQCPEKKREITVAEVSGAKESRSQGNGMKKG